MRIHAPLAWGVSHGILALFVLVFSLAGLPLRGLLAPLFLLGAWSAWALPMPGARPKIGSGVWVLACAALLLVLTASPREGFWTDAPDHIGSLRFQIARGDVFPGEYFHADREGALDLRKGTNHTLFALASALSGIDPGRGYALFWGMHVALLVFTVFWLAGSVLGGRVTPWIATAAFLLLSRAGLEDRGLATAGYPGKAGSLLYLQAAALAVESCRRERKGRGAILGALLGAGTAGVHAFSAVLVGLGAGALAAGLLLVPRFRPDARGPLLFLAGSAAGALPVLLFRMAAAYPPSNPIHLHRQGVLLLPRGLSVIDPVTLAQVIGLAGFVSFFLLPFVAAAGRGFGAGEMFLVTASLVVLLLLLNPLLFPIVDGKAGYLARRIPLLVPSGFVAAAVLRRGWERRGRAGAALPGLAALLAVGTTVLSPAARAEPLRALPFATHESRAPWEDPLERILESIPEEATVLADPVTGYTLFGLRRVHVAAIPDQHSSPNDQEAPRRLADSGRFLSGEMGEGAADALLDRNRTDYILINELFPRDFRTYNVSIHRESFRACRESIERRPERFERIDAPRGLFLYRVSGPPAPPAADLPRRAPSLGRPALRRPMAGDLLLLEGLYSIDRAKPGEGGVVLTRWEAPAGGAGPVPVQLHVRAQPLGSRASERLALRRDPARRPWRGFPLGEPDYPYLIWREGEVVVDSHFVRVPSDLAPGAYEIEVAAEEAPFFPVRRVRGLERGAVRSGWTVIDTVEVLP
ncbi:MAG: hypothetical protein ABIH26_05580 [Candidatus Eisenbacteria bacterium]